VSNTAATLILVASMFVMAIYFVFAPPPGFEEKLVHRFAIPFLLVAGALTLFENLRMRAHISKLVGALRGMMGRTGMPATPEIKREAVDILVKTLQSDDEKARRTAVGQLVRLTGQEALGEDVAAWEKWWADNRERFGES